MSAEKVMKIKHQIFLTRNGLEIEGKMITTSPRFLWKIDLISIFPTPPELCFQKRESKCCLDSSFFYGATYFKILPLSSDIENSLLWPILFNHTPFISSKLKPSYVKNQKCGCKCLNRVFKNLYRFYKESRWHFLFNIPTSMS